jgi:choline dehydrogenase-like flavoprotein
MRPPSEVLQEWETEFGVTGLMGREFQAYTDEVWDTLKVNKTESQMNRNNRALWDGCKALGYREGVDFETIERNAVGCKERCDFCTYGCVYSCKQATILNYLPMAFHNGARFIFNTRADQIVVERGVAKGVEANYFDGTRNVPVSVNAKVVVAACGGLETPALLLRSDVRHAMVGRHLLLHPTAAMGGVLPTEVRAWAGPPQTVAVRKFWNLDGTRHGFFIEAAPAHPGLFALSIPWVDGRAHKDFVKDYYARTTATVILLREWGAGKVAIDKHGSPAVSYELDEKDKENIMAGMEETARILAAAGASEVWTTHNDPVLIRQENGKVDERQLEEFSREVRSRGIKYNRLMLFSAHIMGSCRMSSDPSRGPTKPTGELYDVENLFIGDATVFPTSPGVNPMITIMAMARRTAEFIKPKFSG